MNTGKAFEFVLDYSEQTGTCVRFGQNNTTKDVDPHGYPIQKHPESERCFVEGYAYSHSIEGYGPDMESACSNYLVKAFDKIEEQLANLEHRFRELKATRDRMLEAFPHLKCSVS